MTRALVFLASGSLFLTFAQNPCDKLKSTSFPDSTITAVESVAAGPAQNAGRGGGGAPPAGAPGGRGAAAAPGGRAAAGAPQAAAGGRGAAPAAPVMLPAYCRVAITMKPSSDSSIDMEVWMPAENWNNKFQMVGNGGWAGTMSFPAMQAALREGYATATTDTGHKGGDAIFALNHPEKLVDFAYRAVHETVVKSKTLITAYYGKAPKFSYWNGCSTGGRQGLMEAQKFPDDFDAIVAGAPADYQTHLHAWDMMVAVGIRKDDQHFVSAPKLAALNKAVLAACDAADGVKDGLLNDPRKCKFDPATLSCKNGEDKDDCLTPAQLESVKLVLSPAKKKNGELIFPGKEPGSETAWSMLSQRSPNPAGLSQGTFQYATYQDANWDWHNFDLDRDTSAADEKFGYVNATSDLNAFKNRGGKLLMYHGWSDTAISPENSINLYTNIVQKTGSKSENWIKLYMIPGMGHCQGGGTDQFNKMAVIERWRESNSAPESIVAAHVTGNNVEMTRPLCPYPQVAVYKGVGSTNDSASFSCKAP
jgi:feruloyl esterase